MQQRWQDYLDKAERESRNIGQQSVLVGGHLPAAAGQVGAPQNARRTHAKATRAPQGPVYPPPGAQPYPNDQPPAGYQDPGHPPSDSAVEAAAGRSRVGRHVRPLPLIVGTSAADGGGAGAAVFNGCDVSTRCVPRGLLSGG